MNQRKHRNDIGKPRPPRSIVGWFMLNGKNGDVFYGEKLDREFIGIAMFYNRKIKTQKLISVTIEKSKPKASSIVKITLLN